MAAPANDDFANREVITVAGSPYTGDNTDATLEVGETYYSDEGFDADNSAWYTFVSSTNQVVLLNTNASTGLDDSVIWAFTGTTVDALTLVAYDDDGGDGLLSSLAFLATSGSYEIAVTGYDVGDTGAFSLALSTAELPNNNFADRIVLSNGVPVSGDTTYATLESGETYYSDNGSNAANSVWYEYTVQSTGILTIDTEGSADLTNTSIWVFTGNTVSTLTLVDWDSNGGSTGRSSLSFNVTAGDVYKISVTDGHGAAGAPFVLAVNEFPAATIPANDDFANATAITGCSLIVTGSNRGATLETGETTTDGNGSVWWSWTAPKSGLVYILSEGSIDTGTGVLSLTLGVWQGSTVSSLTAIDTLGVGFVATSGSSYVIRATGSTFDNDGTVMVSISSLQSLVTNPWDMSSVWRSSAGNFPVLRTGICSSTITASCVVATNDTWEDMAGDCGDSSVDGCDLQETDPGWAKTTLPTEECS